MIKLKVSTAALTTAVMLSACTVNTEYSEGPAVSLERPSNIEGEFVSTELGKLYVKEIGTGATTVVLWPSIFTDHKIYGGITQRLSESYRFLLIDGPGHGLSKGLEKEFSLEQCANAIEAILAHYGMEKAVIGGTSWGGLIAAELSLRSPEKVQSLILMNTPMEIDARKPKLSNRFIAFGARVAPGSRVFRNGVARSFFSAETLENNPQYEQDFHAMLKRANRRQLSAAVRSVILRGTPLKNRLSEITVPTLVIAGKADAMYPIEKQRKTAELLQNGTFAPVDGKHISVVEAPETVAEILNEYLKLEAKR